MLGIVSFFVASALVLCFSVDSSLMCEEDAALRILSQVAPVVRCQAVAKGDDNAVVDRRAVMVAAAASVLAIAAPVFAAEEAKPKKSSKYGEYGNICAALPTGSNCHQS